VKIKICGVTTVEDAHNAAALGADAIGLNFHPPSPRYISRETALAVLAGLPPDVEAVGVFVNRSFAEIAGEVRSLRRLTSVQWYGQKREPAAACPLPLIAAFNVSGPENLEEITRYVDLCRKAGRLPAAILVDAHAPGQHGGTGRTAPWDLLATFRPGVPLMLAGGLTPENVAEAVRIVRPDMVDVASGVEAAPGRKDVDRMRRFIDNARAAL
jgi:phosphoribosylanthranilate isomerase